MITKYNHHGAVVSVQEHLIGKHREHCLCWLGCKYFKPNDRPNNCSIANQVFEICVKYDIVSPVWECPKYEKENFDGGEVEKNT